MRQSSILALALFMGFVCLCSTVSAQTTGPNQDIAGSWQGAFVFDGGKVRTILYVGPRSQAGYTGALIDLESGDENCGIKSAPFREPRDTYGSEPGLEHFVTFAGP